MINIPTTQAFGFGQLMVTAAHRYCLGRRTYITSVCSDWLKHNWDLFDGNTKKLILEETREAIQKDCAGDECDADSWKSLIEFAESKEFVNGKA